MLWCDDCSRKESCARRRSLWLDGAASVTGSVRSIGVRRQNGRPRMYFYPFDPYKQTFVEQYDVCAWCGCRRRQSGLVRRYLPRSSQVLGNPAVRYWTNSCRGMPRHCGGCLEAENRYKPEPRLMCKPVVQPVRRISKSGMHELEDMRPLLLRPTDVYSSQAISHHMPATFCCC